MKRFSSWFLLCLMFLPVMAQNSDLEQSLKQYFKNYSLEGFRPKLVIALSDYVVDDDLRTLDVYGNEGFSSQLFTAPIIEKIYNDLRATLPEAYRDHELRIFAFERELSTYIPNYLRSEKDTARLCPSTLDYRGKPWTRRLTEVTTPRQGLQNRHLCVWASHGRYFSSKKDEWIWQRPTLFCTNEDLFTQSIVVPFLIPMLENSGAIVYSPRERDWQAHEVIVDNDQEAPDNGYREINRKEKWRKAPLPGFAQRKDTLLTNENPFFDGTARCINSTTEADESSSVYWTPNLPESGKYAVYVSYQTVEESVDEAVYTIIHKGTRSHVGVNQQMGGSTWVYLGTYEFEAGQPEKNCVVLTNLTAEKGIVTADAVRFGGGMGNIARGDEAFQEQVSGLPRYLEGARYAMQWAGMPDSIFDTKDGYNDYADDINARSNALNYLGGGSTYIPNRQGGHVPFELSLAVHSDAGAEKGNEIVGTLAVHTTPNNDGAHTFGAGYSRLASSDLSALMQMTICEDLSQQLGISWTRREIFDRNYSETRQPEVPSTIIEILSHQNFADMKLGHDPNFKFLMARSIYKSVLKFIATQHATPYTVQPLPVTDFAACLQPDGQVLLSWEATIDPLEPTAQPDGYIIYMRRDGEDYDQGTRIPSTAARINIEPDCIYSFKVCAYNEGGKSFESEELSVMRSSQEKAGVLIVNGFTRLSGPALVDNDEQRGFLLEKDLGVAYQYTPEYSGRQLNFNPNAAGKEGPNGLGYSGEELQGTLIAGNTFNYPYIHGKAIAYSKSHSFSSCSMSALLHHKVQLTDYPITDLILGLQKDCGESSIKSYKTFPDELRPLISNYLKQHGHLIVSGSYIASDMQSTDEARFTQQTLHFGCTTPMPLPDDSLVVGNQLRFSIERELGHSTYAVTHPDRLAPIGPAFPCLTYSDGTCAAIVGATEESTVIALGFPFESIREEEMRQQLMNGFLHLFQ